MPDLIDLFLRWWKQILGLVILSVAVTVIMVYSRKKEYMAVSTALPAPTYASDKTGVFGQNLQTLYPALGTPDDLDMILGTSHLDTVYTAVAQQLNLTDYFGGDKNDADALRKAGSVLKEKSKVIKSDYGELKVKVWNGDGKRAADMSNAIMEKLKQIHQDIQVSNNKIMADGLQLAYDKKLIEYQAMQDSVKGGNYNNSLANVRSASLFQQVQEYAKLLSQYQLMVNTKPEALVIIEKASAPLWPDRPKPAQTILAAFVLSLFFALLVALVLERRRMSKK